MLGLNEVNRKEMNIDGGSCVGYGRAPKIEGCGTVFLAEFAFRLPQQTIHPGHMD
jgi:hypothetical protein